MNQPAPSCPVEPPAERVIQIKVSTLQNLALFGILAVVMAGLALTFYEITKPTVLTGSTRFTTRQAYRPPVEIKVVAKTDSTNLRLAYAADQVIFNWEENPTQLRVDGGPANGLHKNDAGQIPQGKYVTIKWVVTTTNQAIYVDGALRYAHEGDYSHINRPVAVFPANGSTVSVRSVTVKPLATPPH